MKFKRIELNGFKSFADPVVIEFTDGITCIVGPNGSGKSNISDALLWVLGEQSPKTLRSDKLEEVIFSGTQNRKAKGMAEVTLVIDNSDHSLPLEFAEVGITRRAYRSGENEYMINRRPCRLKDIRELIMDTGIGVEGYSMVGQGKIADIVSNKMERRREIFEEAAGIVKYRSRKEKTEKSLAEADLNLSRVTDIIGEIESRIGGLEEDSKKATEYLEIKDKYKDIEINIILKNIAASDEKAAAIKLELAELESALSEAEEKRNSLEEQLRVQRNTANELEERLDELRGKHAEKVEEIHEITGREDLNKERLAALKRDEERLDSELKALAEKLERENANFSGTLEAAKLADEESKALAEQLKERQAASAKAQKELSDAEAELDGKKNELFELSAKLQNIEAHKNSIISLKETLEKRAEKLGEESGINGENEKELQTNLKKSEEALKNLVNSDKDMSKKLEDALKAQAKAEAELAQLGRDAEEARVQIGRLSSRKNLLDELEKAYEGYGGGVKFLMSQKIGGIVGTLGDLLQVPKGYELAIETVLGGKLQNIVCENDAVAKKSIELLKSNKAGRLTFLPAADLKVQPPLGCKEIESKKGFIGLASDMVSCKGGYANVVDYMLGNVVIVDTIDNALAISAKNKGPHKLVTLEGEVINSAGAITGGSFKNNTANILSRKAEKEDLESKIAALEKQTDAFASQKKKLEDAILKAADEKHKAENEIKEADLQRAILERELELAKQSIDDAAGAEKKRNAEHAELLAEIANAQKQADEYAKDQEEIRAKQQTETAASEELSDKVEKLKAAFAEAQSLETAAKVSENAARIKAENAEGLASLAKSTINELELEQQEKNKALESAKIQAEQILAFAGSAGEILASAEAERKKLEEEITECNTTRQQALASANALDEEKSAADKTLYEQQLKKHDADMRMSRCDTHTDDLKQRLWDEYEMSYAEAATHEDPEFVMSRAMKESRDFKARLRALGDVNVGAIEEYKQVKERYDFLTEQKDDILTAMAELRSVIKEMDDIIRARFKESFDSIVINFEKVFTELFKGGHATLSMSDPDNPLESAIEIEAQPPGKKLQNISLLSGGERTLTAIALMFAVLKSKPTPFCILDEVEAALDEANIDVFAKYVRTFDDTQFALVTHQKLTMEYADALYGVTMPERGISKVLSLRLGDDFEV